DFFDCKYMPLDSLNQAKDGLMLCLLGSDKPILESLQPNPVDQMEALKNQFEGMTDVPFSYEDYEATRKELIEKVNQLFTKGDKEFFVSFEQGEPEWSKCCAGDLSVFPSVKWKLQNILKLRETNPLKHDEGVEKLREYLFK
ncbi:MAG: nucleotidyl transferase AbiEii/AbiGii toxin family protein, partial [Bacteroidales bacterium]|nr:nucleotidyl transferase AbiEii/AbiGii toxin family protein [Bacteroidales bacterium]